MLRISNIMNEMIILIKGKTRFHENPICDILHITEEIFMNPQEKLRRTFVREEAYQLLRDWIVEGKLEPGQKLRDKELADQLGVSRTPIREALLRLEDDGLIKTKANSSTVVSPIDFQHAWHLYSIVWSLEQLALEQAFPLLASAHIDLMIQFNQQLLQALKDNERLLAVQADSNFHAVYIELSGNAELQQILSAVKHKLKRLELCYFERAKDVLHSCKEHQKIIDALKREISLLFKRHRIKLESQLFTYSTHSREIPCNPYSVSPFWTC